MAGLSRFATVAVPDLGRLAAAAAVAWALVASPVSGAAPAGPPFGRVTTCYDVQAPSAAELERTVADLEFAVERFERMFGEKPPRIAVRVFASPEEMTAFDKQALLARGLRTQMWLSDDYHRRMKADVRVSSALGAVLAQGTVPGVLAPLPGKGPHGLDLRARDEIVRVQGTRTTTLEALEEALGRLPAGAEVELVLRRNGDEIVRRFAKRDMPAIQATVARVDTTATAAARMRPLTHEVGHVFLKAWTDRCCRGVRGGVPPDDPELYGDDLLPDWLDEAVATGCEVPELQESRLTMMRRDSVDWLPFDSLFAMRHPGDASEWMKDLRRTLGSAAGQRKMIAVAMPAGELPSSSGPFYAESMAVGLFLVERGGPHAIPTLARALAGGERIEQALPRIRGVPAEVADLERAVRDWIRSG